MGALGSPPHVRDIAVATVNAPFRVLNPIAARALPVRSDRETPLRMGQSVRNPFGLMRLGIHDNAAMLGAHVFDGVDGKGSRAGA